MATPCYTNPFGVDSGHIFHIEILSAIFDHNHVDTPIHSSVVLVRHTAAPIIPSHSSRGKSARERLWPHRVWPSHSYSSKPWASQPWVFHNQAWLMFWSTPRLSPLPNQKLNPFWGVTHIGLAATLASKISCPRVDFVSMVEQWHQQIHHLRMKFHIYIYVHISYLCFLV